MKTSISAIALSIILIILASCVTGGEGVEESGADNPVPQESAAAVEAETEAEPEVELGVEPEVEAEAEIEAEIEVKTEAETDFKVEPEKAVEADIEMVVEAEVEEPGGWLPEKTDPKQMILEQLIFPQILNPVYKTPVPIIVRGSSSTRDWRVLFSYSVPGANVGGDIELMISGDDFAGRIYTGIFPGNPIVYSFRVYLPDEDVPVEIEAGRTVVQNNGPSSYSKRELELNFSYEPLFDVVKLGDSPGFRKNDAGWQTRTFTVPEGIKRWSFDIMYRLRGEADWISSGEGVNKGNGQYYIFDTEKNPRNISREYDLNINSLSSGSEIEYCFRLIIHDTREEFLLFADVPPSFRILN